MSCCLCYCTKIKREKNQQNKANQRFTWKADLRGVPTHLGKAILQQKGWSASVWGSPRAPQQPCLLLPRPPALVGSQGQVLCWDKTMGSCVSTSSCAVCALPQRIWETMGPQHPKAPLPSSVLWAVCSHLRQPELASGRKHSLNNTEYVYDKVRRGDVIDPFMIQGCTFYHLHRLSLAFMLADFSPRKDETV